jgi:hypothetical protein
MKNPHRRRLPRTAALWFAAATTFALPWSATPRSLAADDVRYEDVDGIRYQITRRTIQRQIPVTEMRDQQQTYYRQQLVTENIQQQQMYAVPVTQYQIVSTLHGRWNPFVTPYWTHEYQPVTIWQQQVATVQLPVSRATMTPETRTVQTPVVSYRTTNEEVVSRVALGPSSAYAANTALAAAPTTYGTSASTNAVAAQPSATLTPRPSAPPQSAPLVAGGQMLQQDPPREAQGWQRPSGDRYR